MWHTFKPGRYDFGAAEKDKVILSHGEQYLDAFIMVNDGAVGLLNDFYQLTGNPVLLPKFGFYQGHLPIIATTGRRRRTASCCLRTESATTKVKRITAA
jgi:alpha-glucosidase (family GH31 glycosyl hydrolase)